jgi:hypothetical protein
MSEQAKVILYTAPNCGTSDRARADLVSEGVDFEERNVMTQKQWFNDVLKYTIFVPLVIWTDGRVEIGWKGRVG